MIIEDLMDYELELDRLHHDGRCDGLDCDRGQECPLLPCGCPKSGYHCPCGCRTTFFCPSKQLCRERILHLTGAAETKAVKAWMTYSLCICHFVVKNLRRGGGHLSDREFTNLSGNWSAKRRRKLIRCPCGAYFDNATVRKLGLYSESEWKRRGYPKLKAGKTYYIDEATAKWVNPFIYLKLPDGSTRSVTHVRHGPQPVARIWRPFYDFQSRRFETGIYSVDLFSPDQIDLAKYELTREQALKILENMSVK